ncbi:hypothetical protein D3C72_1642740 [compost metagenome]
MIAFAYRRRLDALQVGTGARLRHRDRADHCAGRHLRQVGRFQVIAAVVLDIGRDDLRVQAEAKAGAAGARLLLHQHHAVQLVAAGAAILLGHAGAQETGRASLQPDITVDIPLLFPAFVVREHLGFHEAARGFAQHLVVFVE